MYAPWILTKILIGVAKLIPQAKLVPQGDLGDMAFREKKEVSLPPLILHGEADIVTDPSVSKALYEKASSAHKKLILYKDSYHSLIEGEPDDAISLVLSDIIKWLDDHSMKNETSVII
ncbi:hypothetical protein Droror1_Dr00012918 [Drosera rotundifolia]